MIVEDISQVLFSLFPDLLDHRAGFADQDAFLGLSLHDEVVLCQEAIVRAARGILVGDVDSVGELVAGVEEYFLADYLGNAEDRLLIGVVLVRVPSRPLGRLGV